MTESSASASSADVAELSARLAALEAENAMLVGAGARTGRAAGSRWRAFASAACIVVAALLVPVSIATAWARVQLVDEDAFVATLAPLAADPAVQEMVIDETMSAITAQVDFSELTSRAFDAVDQLGLPPRASSALRLLEAPAASGLEGLVDDAVTRAVESDGFAEVWATVTRGAHRALTLTATSDGGGLVVRTPDGVGIQLGAIVEQVTQRLLDEGIGAAQLIPTVDRVVILGDGDTLAAVRTGYAFSAAVGYWLPVLTLGLFGLGILVARRRSTAVLGTGIALALGGAILAVALSIGSLTMGAVGGRLDISPAALEAVYAGLIEQMTRTGTVIALIGVLVAVLGWFSGARPAATSLRRTISEVNSAARAGLAGRGLDTGGVGRWLGRQRVLVRAVVAVLAVVWLFAIRPLTVADVVLVVVLALVVAWVGELLQRRPEEQPASGDSPWSPDDEPQETPADAGAATGAPASTAD